MLCRHCHQDLPEQDFRSSTLRLKVTKWCRECMCEYEHQQWEKHKQDGGCVYAHRTATHRAWYRKNRAIVLPRQRVYYRANIKAFDFWRARGRARRGGATQFMSLEQWQCLREQTTCHWCQIALSPPITHVDHGVPLCEGEQHTFENGALSCANGNLAREWHRKVNQWKLPVQPMIEEEVIHGF